GGVRSVRRRYRKGTLVLDTEFETEDGVIVLTDCMPPRQNDLDVARIVTCKKGRVPLTMELAVRFGYGAVLPWIISSDDATLAVAGPDALALRTRVPVTRDHSTIRAAFTLGAGERAAFHL